MTFDTSRLIAATWLDHVEYHRELGSTQDRARQAATAGQLPPDHSLLVIADRQTAGRGRGANRWWTGEGSLAFSLLFDPATFALARRAVPQVSMATAVALIDAVEWMAMGCRLGLHWPNDIYAGCRKLAGVLVDVLPDGRHILGVGINTNNAVPDAPPELRDSVASIHWLTGRPIDHTDLLEVFLEQLAIAFRSLARVPDEYGRRFDELCVQHGELLTVRNGSELTSGRCVGIAPDGALLLDTEQGRRSFYSGTLR